MVQYFFWGGSLLSNLEFKWNIKKTVKIWGVNQRGLYAPGTRKWFSVQYTRGTHRNHASAHLQDSFMYTKPPSIPFALGAFEMTPWPKNYLPFFGLYLFLGQNVWHLPFVNSCTENFRRLLVRSRDVINTKHFAGSSLSSLSVIFLPEIKGLGRKK